MKKRTLLEVALSVLVLFTSYLAQAQTPLSTAILDITLQCAGGTGNRTGIAFNPNQQLYYSVNAGNTSYPIETFDITGAQVSTVSQGFDYRGAWWNPNTSVLEGNGHANLGVWIQDLEAINVYVFRLNSQSLIGNGSAHKRLSVWNAFGETSQQCRNQRWRIYWRRGNGQGFLKSIRVRTSMTQESLKLTSRRLMEVFTLMLMCPRQTILET